MSYKNSYTSDCRNWLYSCFRRANSTFINADYTVLGTDGFGRSDTREQLRSFFEVDRHHITIAALKSLADKGEFDAAKVAEAIKNIILMQISLRLG